MSVISQLTVEKLHIFSPFDFDFEDSVSKELGEILSRQKGSIRELKFHECNFPEESSFLLNVVAFMQGPNFTKFHFQGYSESPVLVELLNVFFSTTSSNSQQLLMDGLCQISLDATVRDNVSPMPLAVCDSSLQHKSLWLETCSALFCDWFLSLKPLSFHSLHLMFVANIVEEFYQVIKSLACNDELRVCNLSLVNYANDTRDILDPLSEDSLTSIFKRPLRKSLLLDFRCQTSSLTATCMFRCSLAHSRS